MSYTDVYTHTLASGLDLTIPVEANFGDLMVAGMLLLFTALMGLELLIKLGYGK